MPSNRRSFDLGARAPGLILGGIAAGLRLTTTRTHRRQLEKILAARFPGRLRILAARSLFPRSTGSQFTLAVTDNPDAVVRLLVEDPPPHDLAAKLDEAVENALARSAELRCLLDVFADHGFPVVALESPGPQPTVVATLTDETAEDTLAALGAAVRAWTHERIRSAHPTPPASTAWVAILPHQPPPHRDRALPTPLRLSQRAAAQHTARHVAGYPIVAGVAESMPSTLFVRRDYQVRAAFEERVLEQVRRWLHKHRPESVPTHCHGTWPLKPGHVTEATGHVLLADRHPPHSGRRRADHALSVTVNLAGAFTAPPTVLPNVRDNRGVVTLPPAPPWRTTG